MSRSSKLMVLALVQAVVLTSAVGAFAGHGPAPVIVGGFEVDGNLTFDALAGASSDWENAPGVVVLPDPANTDTDDVFAGGSKELDPDGWKFTTQKPPGKDDLTAVYVSQDVSPAGAFLRMAFERLAVAGQGDAHANFEFNKKSTTIVNSQGTTIPERSDGDLLAVYDYSGGTGPVHLEIRIWDGAVDNPATAQNEEALFGTWNVATLPAGSAGADINGSPVPRPASLGGGTIAAKRFGEMSIDVEGIFGQGFLTCPGFSSFWAKTRSSGESFSSNLKDKVGPAAVDFSTCGSVTVLKQDDEGAALNGATFELWRDVNGDSQLTEAIDTLAGSCVTGEEGIAGRCTFEAVDPAAYLVREASAPQGYALDPTVSAFTVGINQNVTVPHTFVDPRIQYALTMTPLHDANLVGSEHVFTAHLTKSSDGGASYADAAGETIAFTLNGKGTILSATPNGSVAPDGRSATCVTASDGTCELRITSPDAGDTTVSAHFETATVTVPATATADASKQWVNYRIGITPDGHTNDVGSTHEFSVLLERTTDGETWTAVGGAPVAVSITSGPGSVVGDSCASGTDPDGTCTVTISSPSPGQTQVSASYEATEGSSSGTFTTTATKNWVDYRVNVTPDADTNVVGEPHTFVVTVERDTGDGFEPLEGASLDLAWSGPDGSSIIGGSCTEGGTTDPNGQCTVVVSSHGAGSGTLTATFNAQLDSGTTSRSDTGDKTWVAFRLDVTPGTATNEVGEPHVFTVTLGRDSGPGFTGFAGQAVVLALSPGLTDARITAIDAGTVDADGLGGVCTTDGDGKCFVTANATTAGHLVLSASWNGVVGSDSHGSASGSAGKTYVSGAVAKLSCPTDRAVPGQKVTYTIEYTTAGDTLTNATLVDHLPAEADFVGASGGGTHAGNTVTWDLGTLQPGSGSVTLTLRVRPTTQPGTTLANTIVFDADQITPKTHTSSLLVTNEGAAASGRAYGVRTSLLGGLHSAGPVPDTNSANPDQIRTVDVPGVANDVLIAVSESHAVSGTDAQAQAIATTNALNLTLPGVTVSASSVVARSQSTASGFGASSSRSGSRVQDLVVNGTSYGDVTDHKSITVKDALGNTVGEVRILETARAGAAAGVDQPDDGLFGSGMAVNAVHVIVHDLPGTPVNEASDVVVAHAETAVAFPSALGCGEEQPAVYGNAYLTNVHNVTPDAGGALTGNVDLPITGGADHGAVADTTPVGVVSGSTRTEGTLDPLQAVSRAEVNGASLLGGLIQASTVRAKTASAGGSSTGTAVIEDLVINGTNVCDALGLGTTCTPAPNTVLVLSGSNVIVLLNEQIAEGAGGLRVNAVHVFAVGAGNPLGLPAGAELIISSAFSRTS